jgi:diguanylate cyclase (GGDEF)-like protein
VWREARRPGVRVIIAVWLLTAALGVATAVAEALMGWSGLPVAIGTVTVGVTIYPPLFVTVLLAVWLGPLWGAIPAYLATLTSALLSGMPVDIAALFAAATPVELVLIWGSMVTLNVHPDLRSAGDLGRYLLVTVIAATAASLATLIWNETQGLDLVQGQRIWQGWVLGDLLQLWLFVPPVLHWFGPRMRPWVGRRIGVPPRQQISYTRSVVLVAVLLGLLAALVFRGVGMVIETLQVAAALLTPEGGQILDRLGVLALFLGLLFAVTLLTTFVFSSALARIGERERFQGLRDVLTGCFNRRAFPDLFQREAERSRRLEQGISVVFFDIDRFKEINDRYGHEAGDRVLRLLPHRVRGVMREHDLLFRWGGEEFVILLPHTAPADARHLAERIRRTVAEHPLAMQDVPEPISVTLSLGAATAVDLPADPGRLIAEADAACYTAKRQGRNRVCSSETAESEATSTSSPRSPN